MVSRDAAHTLNPIAYNPESRARCGVYEGQSGAPWWMRVDAVTPERYLVAIQSGYINTALPTAVIGPRLAGYGGAPHARGCTAGI